MEISFDKTDQTQGIIKISLNKADYQPGVDQKIKEYSKTANIKGFRKGKVPPGMIRKMYGTALIVDEINKLVSDKLNAYLKQEETQFLGEPIPEKTAENYDWDNQEAFEFNYEIGYAAPFDLKIDKKFKVDRHTIKVDDAVLDETIENLQRQFGELENPEKTSEGDTLFGPVSSQELDLEGKEISIDLRDLEKAALKKATGLSVEDTISLDIKKAFKNENAIKGQLRIGEDDFKKLKKIDFTVKGINHHKLAPIDQSLFDKAFGEGKVANETEFREKVKEAVEKNYETESVKFFEYQLIEKLTDKAKISLPDEFLKKWLLKTNENLTEELLETEYTTYAKELKWSLIRNKVLKDHELNVEHEDVLNEAKELIKQQFAGSGLPEMNDQLDAFANNYLQAQNGENYMKVFNQIQGKKVLASIEEQISVKDKEVSLDEFRKL